MRRPGQAHRFAVVAAALAGAVLAGSCTGNEDAGGATPPPAADVTIQVYFANAALGEDCDDVFPVDRRVDGGDVAAAAVEALLAGPTSTEAEAGYAGWFGAPTAGMLNGVVLADGVLRVDLGDLRDVIPNASTSCGSAGLLAQLDRTLAPFVPGGGVVYLIDGSTEDFYAWLQFDVPPGA